MYNNVLPRACWETPVDALVVSSFMRVPWLLSRNPRPMVAVVQFAAAVLHPAKFCRDETQAMIDD